MSDYHSIADITRLAMDWEESMSTLPRYLRREFAARSWKTKGPIGVPPPQRSWGLADAAPMEFFTQAIDEYGECSQTPIRFVVGRNKVPRSVFG